MSCAFAFCLLLPALLLAQSPSPTTQPNLPNPFLFQDGSPVRTRDDWSRRRAELLELFARYEYGHLPPAPTNLKSVELSSSTNKPLNALHKQFKLSFGPASAPQSLSMV